MLNKDVGNDAAGVSIHDCGDNIYCCGVDSEQACCTDERAFYVDPDDGGVTQTTVAAKTKAPRWFTVDSSSILASASSRSASSTASSVASTTSSTTKTSASSTSLAAATVTAPTKDSSKISAGAGAGIGIGAAAGVVLVGALVWFLLRRRKQNASRSAVNESTTHPVEKQGVQPTCFPHNNNAELDGGCASQELDGGRPRHELDGSAAQTPKRYPGL
jgi:hypothetical protein